MMKLVFEQNTSWKKEKDTGYHNIFSKIIAPNCQNYVKEGVTVLCFNVNLLEKDLSKYLGINWRKF